MESGPTMLPESSPLDMERDMPPSADKPDRLPTDAPRIGAVIPCYRERAHILDVLDRIGPDIDVVFVVDDACPDATGKFVSENCTDPRVRVVFNETNLGVGGATLHGYRKAIEAGIDIVVKLDGDGQMDPALVPELVRPIAAGQADYTKGNRLHRFSSASGMPPTRLFGNMVLTLFSKLSSGYWNIMDPTNGFTAVHTAVLRELPLDRVADGFFFESDMLFRLGEINAVVLDIPMRARYGAEQSHLQVRNIFWEFLFGHIRNGMRRIAGTYFIRDVSIASVELALGLLLGLFGAGYGIYRWHESSVTGIPATAGTVVLAALPIILGMQLILGFLSYDTRRVPSRAIHPDLMDEQALGQDPQQER